MGKSRIFVTDANYKHTRGAVRSLAKKGGPFSFFEEPTIKRVLIDGPREKKA